MALPTSGIHLETSGKTNVEPVATTDPLAFDGAVAAVPPTTAATTRLQTATTVMIVLFMTCPVPFI